MPFILTRTASFSLTPSLQMFIVWYIPKDWSSTSQLQVQRFPKVMVKFELSIGEQNLE